MCMCTRVILCACVFVCLCVHASSRVFSARACVRIVRRSDKDDDVKVTVTFTLHPTPSAGELEWRIKRLPPLAVDIKARPRACEEGSGGAFRLPKQNNGHRHANLLDKFWINIAFAKPFAACRWHQRATTKKAGIGKYLKYAHPGLWAGQRPRH